MLVPTTAPTPLAYFATLVAEGPSLPLAEAAAAIALHDHPELDLAGVLHEIDRLSARLAREVRADAPPLDRLRALGRFFFGELGFAGNVNDYYDPANSYLHHVLRTRRGIPISLAVLWLELARGIDLAAEGVGFPGHFLVQVRLGEGRVVIDPFSGESLGVDELRERLDLHLPQTAGRPDEGRLARHLRPAGNRQILARMLRNLQEIHRTGADWPRFVGVQDRLIVLLPRAWDEYRDRGLALAELGESSRARADLALYLRHAADADDRAAVTQRLRELGRSTF